MSLGLPYRAQHAWRAKGRKVGGRDQSRPPERPKLVVPRTVIPELAARRPRRAHGRVHVDVVAVRIGPQPRHQGGVREGARPDDAVLVAGGRRQRLHDRARHALWRKMDVGGDDRPRQVVRDELPLDRAGRLVHYMRDEAAAQAGTSASGLNTATNVFAGVWAASVTAAATRTAAVMTTLPWRFLIASPPSTQSPSDRRSGVTGHSRTPVTIVNRRSLSSASRDG